MNRLTVKAPSGFICLKDVSENGGVIALKKLSDYEDLAEQGRLIELPCKVGDIVYTISPRYFDCVFNNIEEKCNDYDSFVYLKTWCQNYCPNGYSGIGVIDNLVTGYIMHKGDQLRIITSKAGYRKVDEIFLTKEEAEKKLEELIYEDS